MFIATMSNFLAAIFYYWWRLFIDDVQQIRSESFPNLWSILDESLFWFTFTTFLLRRLAGVKQKKKLDLLFSKGRKLRFDFPSESLNFIIEIHFDILHLPLPPPSLPLPPATIHCLK